MKGIVIALSYEVIIFVHLFNYSFATKGLLKCSMHAGVFFEPCLSIYYLTTKLHFEILSPLQVRRLHSFASIRVKEHNYVRHEPEPDGEALFTLSCSLAASHAAIVSVNFCFNCPLPLLDTKPAHSTHPLPSKPLISCGRIPLTCLFSTLHLAKVYILNFTSALLLYRVERI